MNSKDLTVAAPSSATTNSATERYTIMRGSTRRTRAPAADAVVASPGGGRGVRWQAGDAVEAWMGDMVRHRGVVEEPALQLGVVWIREQGTGMRILIDLNEAGTELRHPEPPPVRR